MSRIQTLIQFLNDNGENSLTARVKRQIGSMIRVVLPQWPGLSGIFIRLCTVFGHPLIHCNIEGAELLIDSRDRAVGHFLLNGIPYEPQELDLLRKCLKPGARFLDIGANIGYFTVLAAKLVGSSGKVIAFEPEPNNFKILKKNVAINNLKNVLLENYAAVDRDKPLTLYLSSYNFGDHRIFDSDDDSIENVGRRHERVDVRGICLDAYLQEKSFNPDFIKIDVQGAEEGVLAGLVETLAGHMDIQLLLEIWPYGMRQFGTNPPELMTMLTALGFHVFEIQSNGMLASFSMQKLTLFQGPREYTNVFACRYPDHLLKLGVKFI